MATCNSKNESPIWTPLRLVGAVTSMVTRIEVSLGKGSMKNNDIWGISSKRQYGISVGGKQNVCLADMWLWRRNYSATEWLRRGNYPATIGLWRRNYSPHKWRYTCCSTNNWAWRRGWSSGNAVNVINILAIHDNFVRMSIARKMLIKILIIASINIIVGLSSKFNYYNLFKRKIRQH